MESGKKLNPLPPLFYKEPTLVVAQKLLGKYLVRRLGSEYLRGMIVETEAYIGEEDPACHAAVGKTMRNEVMYGPPGRAYIYFIYGMYYCLNVVTEPEGYPAAVLIRALQPITGMDKMMALRNRKQIPQLTNGPGKLCQALHLDRSQNGEDLCGKRLFITQGINIAPQDIVAAKRVGIRVGKEFRWRYYIKENQFVSKK